MSVVVVSANIRRMRAFCGLKSSPATMPVSRSRRRGATRPEKADYMLRIGTGLVELAPDPGAASCL